MLTKVKLTKRLSAIAAMIDQGQIIADIGTDHGTLPVACVLNHRCPFAYAVDNKEKPLSKARKLIEQTNTQDQVIAILSDGYHPTFYKATTWILAGLGFFSAKEVLLNALDHVKTLDAIILQPASHLYETRLFCQQENLEIIDEDCVYENKHYYFILKVKSTTKKLNYNEKQLTFGPINILKNRPTFQLYLKDTYQQLQELLKLVPKDSKKAQQLIHQCEMIASLI